MRKNRFGYATKFGLGALLLISSGQGFAEGEWTFQPWKKDDFKAEPTLSVMVGGLDPDISGAGSDTVAGFELSLNCPMVQPPSNKIRQQASIITYDKKGLEITSLELNPHYIIETSPGLGFGFGPGIGYVQAETANAKEYMWALQLGASIHYRAMDFLFLGAEARYQLTQDDTFPTAPNKGADNLRFALKAGVNF